MSKSASPQDTPGPVLLPTPEVQQAQQLLARQQIAVAMERARRVSVDEAPLRAPAID